MTPRIRGSASAMGASSTARNIKGARPPLCSAGAGYFLVVERERDDVDRLAAGLRAAGLAFAAVLRAAGLAFAVVFLAAVRVADAALRAGLAAALRAAGLQAVVLRAVVLRAAGLRAGVRPGTRA